MNPSTDRARQQLEAILPSSWKIVSINARVLGSAGRVVVTVQWPGEHEMSVDIASMSGVEDAIAETVKAFDRMTSSLRQ